MASTLLTPTEIAREALRLLKNNLVMGSRVYRGYESEFPGAPKKGGTVQIRKPVKFQVTKSRVRTSTVITEQYITLNVATQAHVSWGFESEELTLSIEQYSERYIRPAAAVLANQIDADLCELYKNVWNVVAEATTGWGDPQTFLVIAKSMQRMDEEAVPPDERCIVLNPAGHWAMANALHGLTTPSVAEKAIRKGYLGSIASADIYMDQNIKSHTVGYWATDSAAMSSPDRFGVHSTADSAAAGGLPTGAVVGASANQMILMEGINCSTGATAGLVAGDTFTIAGCNAVNPMSGESTGALRSFVVTAHAVPSISTTANPTAVYFQPDMIHTGAYKTVDTIPQLGAVVKYFGVPGSQLPQNLAFHRNAFALVMVPLEVPQGVAFASSVSDDGFSIRIVKAYDMDSDVESIRLDVLYGVKTIYPELAVRIAGAKVGP